MKCNSCFHNCELKENARGKCLVRGNVNGEIVNVVKEKISSIALDPIEKKPLYHFYSGKDILSIGFYGCNLKCPFCQNYSISMDSGNNHFYKDKTKEELLNLALSYKNNIGIAFTYNEPLVNHEYVVEIAKFFEENNLKTVLVTNGCFSEEVCLSVCKYIDAMNIDLKGFTNEFYKSVDGDLDMVKRFIEIAKDHCHIELTTLLIPDKNDSEEEMEEMCKWIASLNKDIPLHLSRFFPRYKMNSGSPTNINKMYKLKQIAEKHLNYVYLGNV